MVGLLLGHGAEAAQVGQQERGGDPFAGDVCDDEAEATFAEVEEVVIVAADLTSLDADAGVFESSEGREGLREQPGLHVLGDFEFVRGAALGFLLFGDDATLRFHGMGELVEADQREGVAVDIAEAGNDSSPGRRFFAEANAAWAWTYR